MILGESIFSVFLPAVPAFSQTGAITVFSDRFVPQFAFAAAAEGRRSRICPSINSPRRLAKCASYSPPVPGNPRCWLIS